MKTSKLFALSLTAALLLAACGGGGFEAAASDSRESALHAQRGFTSVVSFGDSLSDAGTYRPAAIVAETIRPFHALWGRTSAEL